MRIYSRASELTTLVYSILTGIFFRHYSVSAVSMKCEESKEVKFGSPR